MVYPTGGIGRWIINVFVISLAAIQMVEMENFLIHSKLRMISMKFQKIIYDLINIIVHRSQCFTSVLA